MKLSRSQLHPLETPLYGFGGKRVNALGKISLSVSFGDSNNARTEYVNFDVVDISYPYNAIFSRGFINISYPYNPLSLPMHEDASFERSINNLQKSKRGQRNREKGFNGTKKCKHPSIKQRFPVRKTRRHASRKISIIPKSSIQAITPFPEDSNKKIYHSSKLSKAEKCDLSNFLIENLDVIAWLAKDLTGVDRKIVEHALNIDPRTDSRVCPEHRSSHKAT